MLKDVGVAADCEVNLIYDFKPIQAPMLTTKFNYKTGVDGEWHLKINLPLVI